MKFSVSNLGRIQAAEFDIKPLTIFVGKANTNKTWTAYTLYGMLRAMSRSSRLSTFGAPQVRCDQLDAAIISVADRTVDKLIGIITTQSSEPTTSDAPPLEIEVSKAEVEEIAHPMGEYLHFSFHADDIAAILAVERDVVNDSGATLEFRTENFIARGKLKAVIINWNKQYWSIIGVTAAGHALHKYSFVLPNGPVDRDDLKKQVLPHIRWLVESIYDDSIAFPSERKGLAAVLGITDPVRRDLTLSSSNLTQAATDYIRFLWPLQRAVRRQVSQSKALALLEDGILNGKADFHGTAEPRLFGFTGQSGPMVQMNASASFVRSLAGLDLYLRTYANHDVIVIDEPEMNAHPEAQLKLAELFAIMANQGRTVIITTHSPYFVDHLNNLMHGARLPDSVRADMAKHLKLKDGEAFISSENAAAYLFEEDGTVRNLSSDGAVDVGSFARETDYLSDLFSKLCDAEQHGQEQCSTD